MSILYLNEVVLAQQLHCAYEYWYLEFLVVVSWRAALKAPQLFSRLHSKMDQDLVIRGQAAGILLKHLEFQLVLSEPLGT